MAVYFVTAYYEIDVLFFAISFARLMKSGRKLQGMMEAGMAKTSQQKTFGFACLQHGHDARSRSPFANAWIVHLR